MPLKLGSNWKSVGIGEEMRRWAHGNSRVSTRQYLKKQNNIFLDQFRVLQRR